MTTALLLEDIRGASGEASIWDCETGGKRSISSEDAFGGSRVSLTFKPYEAFWLVHDPARPVLAESADGQFQQVILSLDEPWEVRVDAGDQPNLAQHQLAAPA